MTELKRLLEQWENTTTPEEMRNVLWKIYVELETRKESVRREIQHKYKTGTYYYTLGDNEFILDVSYPPHYPHGISIDDCWGYNINKVD